MTEDKQALQPGRAMGRLGKEFYGPKTYRVGNALLCAPRYAKDRVSGFSRFGKER